MDELVVVVIVGVVTACLVPAEVYFRRQKQICGKYAFYELRDRVVRQLLHDPSDENRRFYNLINQLVHRAERFNFWFFSNAVEEFVTSVLEGRGSLEELKSIQLTPLQRELATTILETGRKNSLMVRIVLTRAGTLLLLWPVMRACFRYFWRRYTGPSALGQVVKYVWALGQVVKFNRVWGLTGSKLA